MKKLLALVSVVALSACGGGENVRTVDAFEALAASAPPQRMRALAVPTGADALLNAERLMDFAEGRYKEFFPNPEKTRSMNGWGYRYYAQTGIFLAVINWRVYVVGGVLGPEVQDVGEVSNFITITPGPNQAPTVTLALAAAPAPATSTVVMTATAADADGTVSKVEFFDGTTKLGEATTAPYVYTWANVPAGLRTVTARATDNSGATGSVNSTVLSVTDEVVTPPPVASTMTIASLAKCQTALGSTDPNLYKCLVGNAPVGRQTLDSSKACTMSISDVGLIAVTTGGQTYSVSVPQLPASERFFTKTVNGVSFDYGSTTTSLTSIRIRARSEEKVLGQFFQLGGNFVVEVKRDSPLVDLSCTFPLDLS